MGTGGNLRNPTRQIRIVNHTTMLTDLLGNTPRIIRIPIHISHLTHAASARDRLHQAILGMRIHARGNHNTASRSSTTLDSTLRLIHGIGCCLRG